MGMIRRDAILVAVEAVELRGRDLSYSKDYRP